MRSATSPNPRSPTTSTRAADERDGGHVDGREDVVAIRISDSRISVATIVLAMTLSQPGLRHGPRTSRSLHSNTRNTVALGSSTPASACTASRDHAERGAGDQHDRGRAGDQRREDACRTAWRRRRCGAASSWSRTRRRTRSWSTGSARPRRSATRSAARSRRTPPRPVRARGRDRSRSRRRW